MAAKSNKGKNKEARKRKVLSVGGKQLADSAPEDRPALEEELTQDRERRGVGRPSKWKPEFVDQVAKLAALGATDFEMARFFNINLETFHRWKHEKPSFSNAITLGKDNLDTRVERSLYMKAVGYTFESEKIMNVDGQIHRVPTVEHVVPSDTAIIFWLRNRKRIDWNNADYVPDDPTTAGQVGMRELALAVVNLLRMSASQGVEVPMKTIDAETKK